MGFGSSPIHALFSRKTAHGTKRKYSMRLFAGFRLRVRLSILRFCQFRVRSPVAIPHAHGAPVTYVSLTGKRDAINLNEPFDGGMRSELPTGSGDALAQADEPPLTAQREAEGDLLGRVEGGVESAHSLERRARDRKSVV